MNLELQKNLLFDAIDDLTTAKEIGIKQTAKNIRETLKAYPRPKGNSRRIIKLAFICVYNCLKMLNLYHSGFVSFKIIEQKIKTELETALSAVLIAEEIP